MSRIDGPEKILQKAKHLIKSRGGIIRTSDALRAGIHPRTLYRLRDDGVIEQVSRGFYRLVSRKHLSNPDLVTVALRVPQGIICLVSALSFHQLTTQIPHAVSIARPKGSEPPRLEFPPISIHRFSEAALTAGVEEHTIDGVPIRIYSPEKTLVDCFKFRNKIGMDIFLEALKFYRSRKKPNLPLLMKYAKLCRVDRLIQPYLEMAT